MARIKIKDLPEDMEISKEEMKEIIGAFSSASSFIPTYRKIPSLYLPFKDLNQAWPYE